MKKSIPAILIITVSLLLNACFDEAADYPNAKHYETYSVFVLDNDVYVTGSFEDKESYSDCYWVNGKRFDTEITNTIQTIMGKYNFTKNFTFETFNMKYVVAGEDIYSIYSDAHGWPVFKGESYYKNGVEIAITLDTLEDYFQEIGFIDDTLEIVAHDIALSDGVLYITGSFYGQKDVDGTRSSANGSFLWEDGYCEHSDFQYHYGLFVENGDVYTNDFHNVYKNGVKLNPYEDTATYSRIFVENGTIYTQGYLVIGEYTSDDDTWTCIERNTLPHDSDTYITGLFVINGDIYCCGYYETSGYYSEDFFTTVEYTKPCYYKNGSKIELK